MAQQRFRLHPLLVTTGVVAGAWTLLFLALSQGWLGPDIDRGAQFCEASRSGIVRQPWATYSSLSFLVASLAIAGDVRRHPTVGVTSGTAYAVLVGILGPGSAAMHASESAAGGQIDTLTMYLLASFTAAYAGARLWSWTFPVFLGILVASIGLCEVVSNSVSGEVPVVMTSGNLLFGGLLIATIAGEIVLARRRGTQLRWAAASVVTMLVAFAIWNIAQDGTRWCDPESPLQGHAAWHALNAVAAYLLYRHYVASATVPTTW